MRKHDVRRSAPVVIMTAAAVLPAMGAAESAGASAPSAPSRTFNGPTEDTSHGPVQVSIVVKNKKIADVKSKIDPNSDGRSPFLQEHAVVTLRKEALTAQNAKIDVVSGATETSEAYIQSLQAAVKKARKAKALK